MTAPRRWIRLDVGWEKSDWLAELPAGARLAWILLLGYTKTVGVAGSVKAMTAKGAARDWAITEADFLTMLQAAKAHGAVSEPEEQTWVITGWDRYQQDGAAERQRRHRAERSRLSPLRDVTDRHGPSRSQALRSEETLTLTETKKKTHKGPRSWRICPEDFEPTQKHLDLATELHVNYERELTAFREWEFKDPKTDASKAFFRWLRSAGERSNGNGNGKSQPQYHDLQL